MMRSGSFLILTVMFGSAYTYCLFRTHFLAVKLDKGVGLTRSDCGEIRIRDLKFLKASVTDAGDHAIAKNALFSLKMSNMLAVAYLIVLVMLL